MKKNVHIIAVETIFDTSVEKKKRSWSIANRDTTKIVHNLFFPFSTVPNGLGGGDDIAKRGSLWYRLKGRWASLISRSRKQSVGATVSLSHENTFWPVRTFNPPANEGSILDQCGEVQRIQRSACPRTHTRINRCAHPQMQTNTLWTRRCESSGEIRLVGKLRCSN